MMPPLSFRDNKPPSDSWRKANATIKYLAMRHANLGTDWSSRTAFLWSLCCFGMGVTCYWRQVLNNLLGIFCLTSTGLSPAKNIIIITLQLPEQTAHSWRFLPKHHDSLRSLVSSRPESLTIILGYLAYVNALCPLGTRGWEMRLFRHSNDQQTGDAFAWVSKIELLVPHRPSQVWHGLSGLSFVLFSEGLYSNSQATFPTLLRMTKFLSHTEGQSLQVFSMFELSINLVDLVEIINISY